uniref:Uncharacterized protein n=1 Tax=Ditylenchus dipsaci TaxID=166011 RepID=A0A915EMN2_9BILA
MVALFCCLWSGLEARIRSCPDGKDCSTTGLSFEIEACNIQPCSTSFNVECQFVSEWQEWNHCSKSCGGGRQMRTRKCLASLIFLCDGYAKEERPCNTKACDAADQVQQNKLENVIPEWSDWSDWSKCSCFTLNKFRRRYCKIIDPAIQVFAQAPSSNNRLVNIQLCLNLFIVRSWIRFEALTAWGIPLTNDPASPNLLAKAKWWMANGRDGLIGLCALTLVSMAKGPGPGTVLSLDQKMVVSSVLVRTLNCRLALNRPNALYPSQCQSSILQEAFQNEYCWWFRLLVNTSSSCARPMEPMVGVVELLLALWLFLPVPQSFVLIPAPSNGGKVCIGLAYMTSVCSRPYCSGLLWLHPFHSLTNHHIHRFHRWTVGRVERVDFLLNH